MTNGIWLLFSALRAGLRLHHLPSISCGGATLPAALVLWHAAIAIVLPDCHFVLHSIHLPRTDEFASLQCRGSTADADAMLSRVMLQWLRLQAITRNTQGAVTAGWAVASAGEMRVAPAESMGTAATGS